VARPEAGLGQDSGGPIDTHDRNIRARFEEAIKGAARISRADGLSEGARQEVEEIRERLRGAMTHYNLTAVPFLLHIGEPGVADQYYKTITRENYSSVLLDTCAALMRVADGLAGGAGGDLARAGKQSAVHAVEWARGDYLVQESVGHCASCGSQMIITPDSSEATCSACGRLTRIVGTMFRDDQFYSQETIKGRHSGYIHFRHLKFWLERLQAVENKTFSPGDIQRLQVSIEADGVNSRNLVCETVRRYLKLCGLTGLNDHAPLLTKLLGGRAPPVLPFPAIQRITVDFNRIMNIYSWLFPSSGNRPYYPFFIGKIIEMRFGDEPEIMRIMQYIHKQERDTTIKNDARYRAICEAAPPEYELKYKPSEF